MKTAMINHRHMLTILRYSYKMTAGHMYAVLLHIHQYLRRQNISKTLQLINIQSKIKIKAKLDITNAFLLQQQQIHLAISYVSAIVFFCYLFLVSQLHPCCFVDFLMIPRTFTSLINHIFQNANKISLR